MSDLLLTHFQSAALDLPNRVCMAPMTRGRADNPGHVPPELEVEYYTQRATAGLLITEGTHISPRANGWENVPGIYTPEQVAGWRKVTDSVHKAGGRIFCQLWHQGRISHPDLLGGELPLAPSAMTAKGVNAYLRGGYVPSPVPQAASLDEVHGMIGEFRHAAKCAAEAGFDGVEIHGANGYLVNQFLSGQSNQRTDEYGGTIENKARFLFEVLDAVGEVLPAGRIALRLSPSMNDMQGITIDPELNATFDYLVPKLSRYGLAYLHFLNPMKPVDDVPWAVADVAKHYRPMYEGTLMINSGFNFESGNKVIADGFADLVSFGRPFIANPDLVSRFRSGKKLAEGDKETFYTPGAEGYTTYPSAS
ncbi:alkene reductase [Granulicella arctica]|uniref:alkene reductase n=1 Tax=Granulicella arctica TaxID=940613 RepID=UPI0021DFECA5|nr:alkene reductase [Granulicella arctica]